MFRTPGCDEMAGHLQRTSSGLQESVGRTGVCPEPLREHGVAGDRLLGQRVPPRVPITRARLLVEKLLRNRLLERGQHGLLVRLRHLDEQPVVERAPEHGARPQDVDVLVVEPSETQEYRLAHGLRELEGVERAPVPTRVRLKDLTPVDRLPQHLLEDERVPFRPLVDERGELRADVLRAQDRRDHLRDLRLRHCADRDRLGESATTPGLDGARQRVKPVELVAPVCREQHHPALRETPGCVLEQLTCRAVGPVDVIEDDEQGVRAGPEVEQRDERLEEAQPRLRLVTGLRRRLPLAELREHLGQLRDHRAELGAQGTEILFVELCPDRLDER